MKVELDLSNYAIKDLKTATGVDTSKFVSHVDKLDIDKLKNVLTNLSNLKNKVDKLDVYKLVPVELRKLSNAVKNDFVYNVYITYIMLK